MMTSHYVGKRKRDSSKLYYKWKFLLRVSFREWTSPVRCSDYTSGLYSTSNGGCKDCGFHVYPTLDEVLRYSRGFLGGLVLDPRLRLVRVQVKHQIASGRGEGNSGRYKRNRRITQFKRLPKVETWSWMKVPFGTKVYTVKQLKAMAKKRGAGVDG